MALLYRYWVANENVETIEREEKMEGFKKVSVFHNDMHTDQERNVVS